MVQLLHMDMHKLLDTIRPILQIHQIKRAELFGSVVTGNLQSTSDIDILVELPKAKRGLAYIEEKLDLQNELESATGRAIDLVEYHLVKPALKKYIFERTISVL